MFENFKNVLRNTLPSYFIALILCVVVGLCYQTENGGSLSEIQLMTETLAENFVISPWLILPVLSVFAVILLKIPAIPGILFMAFIGAFCGIFVQGETIAAVMKTAYSGFVDFLRSILWWCFGSIRYIAILLGKNDAFCQKG